MAKERKWKVPESRASDMEGKGLTFIRPSKLAEDNVNGVILEGTFIESLPNPFDNEKLDFKFSDLKSGSTVIINGAGNLGYQMKSIPEGSNVQVAYNGKKAIKAGKMKGRMAHDFLVLEEEREA
tara:strand:- start:423 stop:794 length:372 start_codon:yes stop_codon:yes gene_type:complete